MNFTDLVDLAAARVGGRAIAANDEFFAPKSSLVKAGRAIFMPERFTTRGKWMDGWETRRRRTPGYDWCVVALGMRGVVRGVNVDTSHFTGNFPEECSIDAIDASRPPAPKVFGAGSPPWTTILSKARLRGNGDNLFGVDDPRAWTHVRLNIFPDGGVARLRVYGEVAVDWRRVARGSRTVDLAAVQHGGLVLLASDMHFGAKENLIMPGRAKNMGDGWETSRRRGPGFDWAIVRLGAPGLIAKVEVDTNHFKGNAPGSCSLEGCLVRDHSPDTLPQASWAELLPRTPLKPHRRQFFARELNTSGAVSCVRLNIFPDGGISRLRIHGTLADAQ